MQCSETECDVYNYLNEHRGSRIETQVLMDNLKVHLGIGRHGNGDLPRILFEVFDIKKDSGFYVIPKEFSFNKN